MKPVDGFNAAVELPHLHASNPQLRYQMGLTMVDALAVLATVGRAQRDRLHQVLRR
jgi:hypothetical protein